MSEIGLRTLINDLKLNIDDLICVYFRFIIYF